MLSSHMHHFNPGFCRNVVADRGMLNKCAGRCWQKAKFFCPQHLYCISSGRPSNYRVISTQCVFSTANCEPGEWFECACWLSTLAKMQCDCNINTKLLDLKTCFDSFTVKGNKYMMWQRWIFKLTAILIYTLKGICTAWQWRNVAPVFYRA